MILILDIYQNLLKSEVENFFYTLYKQIFSREDITMEGFLGSINYDRDTGFKTFIRKILSKCEHLTEDIINDNYEDINWKFENIAKLSWITKEVVDRNPHWNIGKLYEEHWRNKLLISIKIPFLHQSELNKALDFSNMKEGSNLKTVVLISESLIFYCIVKNDDGNFGTSSTVMNDMFLNTRFGLNLTLDNLIKESRKYKTQTYV